MLPLGFQLSCAESVKCRFVEFFVFDYDSLPVYILCFVVGGFTFPLVSIDKDITDVN